MRTINYPDVIKEPAEQLLALEKEQKQVRAQGQQQAGEMVGLRSPQSQALWRRFANQGLDSHKTHPM